MINIILMCEREKISGTNYNRILQWLRNWEVVYSKTSFLAFSTDVYPKLQATWFTIYFSCLIWSIIELYEEIKPNYLQRLHVLWVYVQAFHQLLQLSISPSPSTPLTNFGGIVLHPPGRWPLFLECHRQTAAQVWAWRFGGNNEIRFRLVW